MDNDKGGWIPPGIMKQITKYTEYDEELIYVRGNNVNFDTPPVISNNRTLIPVRAVTEALGCGVEWLSPRAFITSPDGEKILVFDLTLSEVYVLTDEEFEDVIKTLTGMLEFDEDEDEGDEELVQEKLNLLLPHWDLSEFKVEIDEGPSLKDNRTYVPLRFIAEQLGLIVDYISDTGEIIVEDDTEEKPEIDPEIIVVNAATGLMAVTEIEFELNGYTFVEIDGLVEASDTEGNDFSVAADGESVEFTYEFLNGLDDVENTLEFIFEKDSDEVSVELDIVLNFLKEQPVLEPSEIVVNDATQLLAVKTVGFDLNGFDFIEIEGLEESTDSVVKDFALADDGKSIEFANGFLTGLGDAGVVENELVFVFERNDVEVELTLDIVLNYFEEEPVVEPGEFVMVEGETEEDLDLEFTLFGFGVESAVLVDSDDAVIVLEAGDIDLDAEEVTLDDGFLNGLEAGVYILELTFDRDGEDVVVEVVITVLAIPEISLEGMVIVDAPDTEDGIDEGYELSLVYNDFEPVAVDFVMDGDEAVVLEEVSSDEDGITYKVTEAFILGLEDAEFVIDFAFENGDFDKVLSHEIETVFNYVAPVVTAPDSLEIDDEAAEGEDYDTTLVFGVEYNDFELSGLFYKEVLTEDDVEGDVELPETSYEVGEEPDEVTLLADALESLDAGEYVVTFVFERPEGEVERTEKVSFNVVVVAPEASDSVEE